MTAHRKSHQARFQFDRIQTGADRITHSQQVNQTLSVWMPYI